MTVSAVVAQPAPERDLKAQVQAAIDNAIAVEPRSQLLMEGHGPNDLSHVVKAVESLGLKVIQRPEPVDELWPGKVEYLAYDVRLPYAISITFPIKDWLINTSGYTLKVVDAGWNVFSIYATRAWRGFKSTLFNLLVIGYIMVMIGGLLAIVLNFEQVALAIASFFIVLGGIH